MQVGGQEVPKFCLLQGSELGESTLSGEHKISQSWCNTWIDVTMTRGSGKKEKGGRAVM